MKVLVVHNRYRSSTPSGENQVVDSEIAALRGLGITVLPYIRDSDEIDTWSVRRRVALPMLPIYSPSAVAHVRDVIGRERPDIVHLHNPYPLVSPAIVRVASHAGVPVVQSVHNHRHVCVKGIYFRDGKICSDCLGKAIPWPAVLHGCYQDSRARSVPMAAALVAHRGTWQLVDRFLALTPQIAAHLRAAGIPDERITIRPNTVADPGSAPTSRGSGFVFAGRLSEEKGVALLVDAWRRHGDQQLGPLTVLGDGPLRHLVDALAAERTDVRVLGRVDAPRVAAEMRAAAAIVVPSTCPEAFPMVVVEALANARPVIGTALGGLPGIIDAEIGMLVPPDAASLARAFQQLPVLNTTSTSAAARARYERLYSPAVVYRQLIESYEELAGREPKTGQERSEAESHT